MNALSDGLTCTIHAAHDLRLQREAHQPLGAHDVRLRLGAAGICGSDLHYYSEGRVGAFQIREPLVPGHEASGVVAEVGAEVTRVKPGDKVAINPSHACGHCDFCREGRLNLCRSMFFLGSASVFPHAQGLFREAIVIGEAQLTPIHEGDITLGEIACAEPLSIGLHAVRRAGEVLGRTVFVAGGGTIGCMSVLAARAAGAARVCVSEPNDRARAMALSVGADEAVAADAAALAPLAERFDICIEAAGHPLALQSCLGAARRGAVVVQVGTLPPSIEFPANALMVRELDYRGAFRAEREFDMAVQAIRTRRIDVRPLITAQIPLQRAQEAFDLALDRTRSTKVQLVAPD
jgi:L-idonate 5-dehydrogenase